MDFCYGNQLRTITLQKNFQWGICKIVPHILEWKSLGQSYLDDMNINLNIILNISVKIAWISPGTSTYSIRFSQLFIQEKRTCSFHWQNELPRNCLKWIFRVKMVAKTKTHRGPLNLIDFFKVITWERFCELLRRNKMSSSVSFLFKKKK